MTVLNECQSTAFKFAAAFEKKKKANRILLIKTKPKTPQKLVIFRKDEKKKCRSHFLN